MKHGAWILCILVAPALSDPEVLPLPGVDIPFTEDGRLTGRALVEGLAEALDLEFEAPERLEEIGWTVRGWRGLFAVEILERTLGEGWELALHRDRLRVEWDPVILARRREGVRASLRTFLLARLDPEGDHTERYGIRTPDPPLREGKETVLILHGIDSRPEKMEDLASAIESEGYVVWRFRYPNDQGIDASADLLASELIRLHEEHGTLRIQLVAHSMGGIVARAYLETERYGEDVDRLIQIATPNHGSDFAKLRTILDFTERREAEGLRERFTDAVADGLGQAGDDLTPDSPFLTRLNTLPRREGVRYATVAGTGGRLSIEQREALADRIRAAAGRTRAGSLRGALLTRAADEIGGLDEIVRNRGDELVSIERARLDGVHTFETVPSDHSGIVRAGPDGSIPCLPFVLRELRAETPQPR